MIRFVIKDRVEGTYAMKTKYGRPRLRGTSLDEAHLYSQIGHAKNSLPHINGRVNCDIIKVDVQIKEVGIVK